MYNVLEIAQNKPYLGSIDRVQNVLKFVQFIHHTPLSEISVV